MKRDRITKFTLILAGTIAIDSLQVHAFSTVYSHDATGNQLAQNGSAQFDAPGISIQPKDAFLTSEGTVRFLVFASGSGLITYQWRHNGIPIDGATGDVLVISGISPLEQDFGLYDVVISNGSGTEVVSTQVSISRDANGNGIPDSWEMDRFGEHIPFPSRDFDGDGLSDREEYFMGTNPLIPTLVFENPGQVLQVRIPPSAVALEIHIPNRTGDIQSVNLPPGLLLDSSEGMISGIPSTTGIFATSFEAPASGANWQVSIQFEILEVIGWGDDWSGKLDPPVGLSGLVAIAAGSEHSLALLSDGSVVGWGENELGQVTPPVGLQDAVAISAGSHHSLALLADGTVAAWGDNSFSQSTPPSSLGGVIAISAGESHSLALLSDGTVVGWGSNQFDQATPPGRASVVDISAGAYHNLALLADGTVIAWGEDASEKTSPPEGLDDVVAIAAGIEHNLALRSDGTIVGWGDDSYGQATPPAGLGNVVAIAAGGYHSLALLSDGTVVRWGIDNYGQAAPSQGITDMVSIAAGASHSLALTRIVNADGPLLVAPPFALAYLSSPAHLRVASKGSNPTFTASGLPDGLIMNPSTGIISGIPIVAGSFVVDLDVATDQGTASAALRYFIVDPYGLPFDSALSPSGLTFQAGGGGGWFIQQQVVPTGISSAAKSVSTGDDTTAWIETSVSGPGELAFYRKISSQANLGSLILYVNGAVVASWSGEQEWTRETFSIPEGEHTIRWEYNTGQGTGIGVDAAFLAQVMFTGVNGPFHLTLSATNGTIVVSPTKALYNQGEFVDLEAVPDPGYEFAGWSGDLGGTSKWAGLVMSSNRSVTANFKKPELVVWGKYDNDYFGNSPTSGLVDITAIAAGEENALALRSNGTVAGWSYELYGVPPPPGLANVAAIAANFQSIALRSDGTVVEWGGSSPPAGLDDVIAIDAGRWFSLALRSDGTITGWQSGGFGNEWNVNDPPTKDITDAVAMAAGYYHGLALLADGTVVAVGENEDAQATVPAGLSGVVAIAAGAYHNLALRSNGTIVAWGNNFYGQASPPAGLTDVVAIAAGEYHSLALKSDGKVIGWGRNPDGRTTAPSWLSNVVSIAAGGEFSMALTGTRSAGGTLIIAPLRSLAFTSFPVHIRVAAKGNNPVFSASDLPEGLEINSSSGIITGIPTVAGVYSITVNASTEEGNATKELKLFVNSAPTIERTLTLNAINGSITASPDKPTYDNNETVTLTAVPAPGYEFNGWSGALSGATNPQILVMSSDYTVTANFTLPFSSSALSPSGLEFTRGGDAQWYIQTDVTRAGRPSAGRSGNTGDSSICWIETTIIGPGTLTYWRRVSSEGGYDVFRVRRNGAVVESRSGEVAWEMQSMAIHGGTHVIRWEYQKNSSGYEGLDAAFLDEVMWTPEGGGFDAWPILATLPPDKRGPLDRNGPLQIQNLMAYTMGLDPLASTNADLLRLELLDRQIGRARFSFQRAKNPEFASLAIEQSLDLKTWQEAEPLSWTIVEDLGHAERVTVELDISNANDRLFARLAARSTAPMWMAASLTDAPQGASRATAIWSGSEMIVWGGRRAGAGGGNRINTGGRYDPATDTWQPTNQTGAPSPRAYHTAVWSGSEMIVWGGEDGDSGSNPFGDGARYNPTTDTWSPISMINAPLPRSRHVAVWSGSEMIIWSGKTGTGQVTDTGARYNPATDTWTTLPISGAPVARKRAEAVWTGDEMIVWGGENDAQNTSFNTGGHFNPATNLWEATSVTGAPVGRAYFTPVWTGSEMIVWGGFQRGVGRIDSGGLYNPLTRIWRSTSLNGWPPSRRNSYAASWSGNSMIVFGGVDGSTLGNGALYYPDADTWKPLPINGIPSPRNRNLGIWSGNEFITWGGNAGLNYLNDAHRLRP